jgi:small redox-active disulfide protein 2
MEATLMKIQILGTGCPKCNQLAEAAEATANNLGLDFELVKVTDINDIVAFGVMSTPALAVDGVVKATGRIPSSQELGEMLK